MLVPLRPHMWLRFTDDIDRQWRHGRRDLHEFRIKGSQLVSDLYSKSTVSQQYLLQTSCHPRHCCKSIPYSSENKKDIYVLKGLTMKDAHTSCLLISVAVATKAKMWTWALPKQAAYKDMIS